MSLESGKIKVVCHGCGARYQVSSAKVHGRKFRATCKRCGGIIVARCTGTSMVTSEEERQTEEAIHLADKRHAHQEEAPWYVVIGGKPHGPLTKIQVSQSFNSRQINERTYMWKTGDPEWRRLGEVPDFADLMGEEPTSYYQAEEDEPTLNPDQGGVVGEIVDGVSKVGPGPGPAQAPETTGETRIRFSPQDQPAEGDGEPAHYQHPGHQQPVEPGLAPTGQVEPRLPQEMAAAGPTDPGYVDKAHEVWSDPQPEPWPLPGSSRRKATLPAPTGEPRHLSRDLPPLDRPSPSPSPLPSRSVPLAAKPVEEPREPSEPVGSLSDLVPEAAKGTASPGSPELSPAPSFSTPGLPPPPRPVDQEGFAGSLSPQTAPSDLLIPVKESFWTLGKIIGVAAIGGGLVVAMAVVIGVMVTRSGLEAPNQQTRIKKAPHLASAPRVKAKAAVPASATLAKVGSKDRTSAQPEKEPGTKQVAASQGSGGGSASQGSGGGSASQGSGGGSGTSSASGGKAPMSGQPASESTRAPPAPSMADRKTDRASGSVKTVASDQRVMHRPKPSTRPRAKSAARSSGSSRSRTKHSAAADVDALLSAAAERRPKKASGSSVAADVDDILQVGTRSRRRSSGDSSEVDDILQVGKRRRRSSSSPSTSASRAGSARATSLTKEQIRRTMMKVMPQVRSCMAKFNPGSGLLQVHMTVSGDGVPKAKVVGDFFGRPVSYCVLDGIYKLRFPPFSGPAVSFNYPFKL